MLGGIIKRGNVISTSDIKATDLIGASERELGSHLKKLGLCKRFKEVGAMHTDEEVKEKGKEYIMLDDDMKQVLEVTGYQDIKRFSCIDFDKPINSMQIGMMPAKLTQIMVNIAVGKVANSENNKKLTIYDPFMGLGTTYMVANSL
jgi:tRNA G10  N-methylase Trm11